MTQPPMAKRIPTSRTNHGDTIIDDYAWLEEKDNPAVTAYLTAENDHTEKATAHLAGLRETLFEEIRTRTQETDLSVPVRKGGHWYNTGTVEGSQYPIHCRVRVAVGDGAAGATPPSTADGRPLDGEEVLLDENVLAGDGAF